MKLARLVLVTAFLFAFGILSGSEAGDGSGVLVHGQPPCTVTLKAGESIQMAIDKAAEGAVICLGPGTYEENITISKGLTLLGTGAKPEDVRIVGVKERYPVMRIESEEEIEVKLESLTAAEAKGEGVQALGKAKAVIHNVQVLGNREAGLWVGDSATVTITNSQVSDNWDGLEVRGWANVTITDSKVYGNFYGLRVEDSAKVSLTDSKVHGNFYGLEVENSANVSLTDSKVYDNRSAGLWVGDSATVTITNSKVSGNGGLGLLVLDSAKVEINENIINDNKSCGVFVLSHEAQVSGTHNIMLGNWADLCGFAPASLRKPLVPQDPRPSLAVPADYATVQQAIDAIVPGGTIEIAAGIYEEGLTIWKPVVLRGAGLDKTILQAMPERGLVLSIISEVQGVRIEGLQVRGSHGAGLLIYGRDFTIQDALISDNRWAGLDVRGSATVSLINSQVSDNRRGLWVWDSANVTLTNSQVSGNEAGLWVLDSANVNLTNSQVSDNGWGGLLVWDSAKVEVRYSTIEGNGTDPKCQKLDYICNGITVWGRSWTTIMDSKIINNTDWGVAAVLKKCGYYDDFTGKVIIDSLTRIWLAEREDEQTTKRTEITGNNKAGNHEGEVCLP